MTEVGYCNFCQRPRNLRTEAHHLGTLVRTIVTCETCHRTLSSSIGVATEEPVKAAPETELEPHLKPAAKAAALAAPAVAAPARQPSPAKKSVAKKPVAKKPAPKKPAPKKASVRSGKPTSTAARKSTRKK